MPERRSRPRASGAEFRGGGSARHWGDPDALERQALLEALTSADDEILRGEMPLSPGSVLGVARRVPEWLRRLRRGLTPKTGTSTAPANVLRDIVLSNKPANLSRRSFLTSPVQTAVDIPYALREIGLKEANIQSGDELQSGAENPPPGSLLSEAIQNDPDEFGDFPLVDPWDKLIDLSLEIEKTGYRPPTRYGGTHGPKGNILRDLETMGRVYRDQVIKEIAEETGKSYEEAKADVRRRQEEPGPVAQAAAGVRRRFGRRRRK